MLKIFAALLVVVGTGCSASTGATDAATTQAPPAPSAISTPATTIVVPESLPANPEVAGLVTTLFGDNPPPLLFVDTGSDFFAIDDTGPAELDVDGPVFSIAGNWVAGTEFIAPLGEPDEQVAYGCPDVFSRGDQVVIADWCLGPTLRLIDADTGAELPTPDFPPRSGEDVIGYWFAEASGTQVIATIDVEGNLSSAATNDGVDVTGEDYPGVAALSTDGALFIYGDHSQSPSPHFTNTVTARGTADGTVFGTWTVPGVVRGIQSDGTWLLITEIAEEAALEGLDKIVATTAIHLPSGAESRGVAPYELFLPR